MRKVKRNQRNKAFLGALIGAGVSLIGNTIGSIIGANAQKKQQREQERQQIEQNNLTTAANLANAINGSQDVVDSYYDRVTLMPLGGKKKLGAWGTQDTNDIINGVSSGIGSVVKSVIGANTMGNIQTVRQAPAQFEPKVLVRPTYYNRIQPMQKIFKCGGRKPDGGIVQYEDDPMVLRDIRRAQDARRNRQFDRDLAKIAGIIGATGVAAYPLSGYAAAEAAATALPTGESLVQYLPYAGEWVPSTYMEAAFAPAQYKALKEYGPQAWEALKSMGRDIKAKFSRKNNNEEYGPYNLSEIVVEAPRKRHNNKYKRKAK